MKTLVIGSNGQLGSCLCNTLSPNHSLVKSTSADVDVSNKTDVLHHIKKISPDIIINAAAYTAVDKAESEPERAAAVNTHGPENLALAAKQVGARLVHVSTDYVFDGSGQVPYQESDAVNPLGVYGQTKLAGELLVQSILPEAIILRTAWVFSEYGNNFVKTMLRLAKDRQELGVVADQVGCPTYAGDIAAAILNLVAGNAPGGIYHYCGDRSVSWAEFAQAIFAEGEQSGVLARQPKVNFITTDQYPTPAKRPAYSVLSTEKVADYYPASDWQAALTKIIPNL